MVPFQGESLNKLTYVNYKDEAFIKNHAEFILTKFDIQIQARNCIHCLIPDSTTEFFCDFHKSLHVSL